MAELIKPCPFCGSGVAKIKVGSSFMWEHAIECIDCGASTKVIGAFTPSSARKRAIEAWNNRVTEAEIRDSIITDFLQFVCDNANNEEYANENGWAMSDLIDLELEYFKQLKERE